MANTTDAGFLERLGLGQDPRAVLAASRQGQGNRFANQQAALGAGAAPLVGGAISGVAGLISGKEGRGLSGFRKNFSTGFENIEDRQMAEASGIDVETLRNQRAFKNDLAALRIPNNGSFESRIKLAQAAARLAMERGLPDQLAAALSEINVIKSEQLEFNKLQSTTKESAAEATEAGIQTGFSADGKPQTGILTISDGKAGILTTVGGELVHKPFDESFSLNDPSVGRKNETNTTVLARIFKSPERTKIRNLASSANTALLKTDRVLSTLTDLFRQGGVESVIGTSGGFIVGIDNLVRNVGGVISAFASGGVSADSRVNPREGRTWAGKDGLIKLAAGAGNSFSNIIQLPEGVRRTSAAAQQHIAAVMEMAYMAARLAEPSNRGLSDNDIQNALKRIAGDTSDPQVMMRRFLEMQVDAAQELDFELDLRHGSALDSNSAVISDDEVDRFFVGKGLELYRDRKARLFTKFGITVDPSGRAIFAEGFSIGTDVQPGEGILAPAAQGTTLPPIAQTLAEMKAEAAALRAEIEAEKEGMQ